jgi:hypothetical protein
MPNTTLIITQTYLDEQPLIKRIANTFFNTGRIYNFDKYNNNLDEEMYSHYKNQNQILEFNFDQKKDFKANILSFFIHYPNPTLLFLGNLSNYSTALQEGMLKLLEEPPHNLFPVIFSLDTVNILPTISSRSQKILTPISYILPNLNPEMLLKTKKIIPTPLEFSQNLIKDYPENITLPELKLVEREELNFWLWQVNFYLSKLYQKNPQISLASAINRVLQVQKFNNSNVQKKLSLGYLQV